MSKRHRFVIPDDQKVVRKLLGMRDPAYFAGRRYAPHLRCGICQEPFEVGESTTYLDGERVHRDCVEAA